MPNQTISYFSHLIKKSKKLKENEQDILVQRLKGLTLKKIGKSYKVTGEAIRQREKKALEKLIKKIYQLMLFDN